MMLRPLLAAVLLGTGVFSSPPLSADPLSKKIDVDFFRDVPSRNLKGLAARSDGRLVAGPILTPLKGELPADLLWALEPAGSGQWLLGTGPDGRVLEVTIDPSAPTFTTRTLATLEETQVLSLRRLADGRILAGTSPHGRLYLLAGDGTVQTQLALPVDSILDLTLADEDTMLVATGNPGRIYRIKLSDFAQAGISADKVSDSSTLTAKGVTLLAEIRDRNVRRLVIAGNRIIAGSAPRGNLYTLPLDATPGTAPVILQENRDAEVTDLYPLPNGDFYAAIVFAGTTAESRLNRPASPADRTAPAAEPGATERFPGRSSLIHYPLNGFPETVAARTGIAFYRIAPRGDLLLLAGGEQGDLLAYSITERRSMNFAGSEAAQLNGLAAADAEGNTFILAGNNTAQLARLSFTETGLRSAETRRLDLGSPTRLGSLRFNRLRDLTPSQIAVSFRTSQATDDLEGWTPWQSAQATSDEGWKSDAAPGRYAQIRIELPGSSPTTLQIDRGSLYHLPQNRRPQLQDFRLLSPNYGLIPRAEQPSTATMTLGQILGVSGGTTPTDDRRPGTVLQSQVVPAPGTQIAYWNVTDPDGDTLAATFSIRRDGTDTWTDLALSVKDPYVQFEFSHLPDGVYFTRLVVSEQSPRPEGERLSALFETDDLVIDRTAPEIQAAAVARAAGRVTVSVTGRDSASVLAGVEYLFNNGYKHTVEQPSDGILDGREETFVSDLPESVVSGATSAEIILYDAVGNSTARRLAL
ncbi:hypothetical protein MASR2M8_01780 [Opitutaceae bacterium]